MSDHSTPATTIDHENMGTRVIDMPGARWVSTVVTSVTDTTTIAISTMISDNAQSSTASTRVPFGPPSMKYEVMKRPPPTK